MNSITTPQIDVDADTPIFVRAIVQEGQRTAARWARYDLPAVTPLTSFPDFAEASAKRAKIAVKRTEVFNELNAAITAYSAGWSTHQDEQTERQANAILNERSDEAFEGLDELNARIAKLRQKLAGYVRALQIQDEVVASIKSERSIDAAAAMEAAHRDAVRSIATAIAMLREAFDREEACRTQVVQGGYDGRLPSFAAGRILRGNEEVHDIERRAIEYGK